MVRVLVIDDEPDVLTVCRMHLEHAGHEVHVAESAEIGLAIAREVRPDIIVLDVMMPVRDVFDVLVTLLAEQSPAPSRNRPTSASNAGVQLWRRCFGASPRTARSLGDDRSPAPLSPGSGKGPPVDEGERPAWLLRRIETEANVFARADSLRGIQTSSAVQVAERRAKLRR